MSLLFFFEECNVIVQARAFHLLLSRRASSFDFVILANRRRERYEKRHHQRSERKRSQGEGDASTPLADVERTRVKHRAASLHDDNHQENLRREQGDEERIFADAGEDVHPVGHRSTVALVRELHQDKGGEDLRVVRAEAIQQISHDEELVRNLREDVESHGAVDELAGVGGRLSQRLVARRIRGEGEGRQGIDDEIDEEQLDGGEQRARAYASAPPTETTTQVTLAVS